MAKLSEIVGDVVIVNATPHSVRFRAPDGAVVEVEPSGYTLPADEDGLRELDEIERSMGELDYVIVGSLDSARAYPVVVALDGEPDSVRKPPAERVYCGNKFSDL